MGTDTEVLKVEYAHIIKDYDILKRRVDCMEEVIINLRIGIAKIVALGALSSTIATTVISALMLHFFFKT